MAVDAVKAVRTETEYRFPVSLISSDGKHKYPIENIGIVKAHGQSALQS